MAQAKEEANRTIAISREKAEKRLEDNELIQAAKIRAEQIIDEAHKESSITQREADKYILDTLTNLELHMDRLLAQVRNGIKTMQRELYEPTQEQEDQIPPEDNLL